MAELMDETFGRYLLHRRFAVGGMAELFLAQQRASADVWRLVVVKRLLPQFADDEYYCTMFLDEARIASRLSHPNVVQVIDFGSQDGRQFMAMEYVPGETLREVLRINIEHGMTLPLNVALQLIIDACDGLHYAHEYADDGVPLGLVHRDISPTNLMITYQGQVKVLDFGIAKAAGRVQDKTATGITKGKISYMPPEQYRAEPLDRRADVWALATVAYEAITGVHPFRRATEEATMKAILLDDLAPASAFRAGLPAGLDEVLARAMSIEANDRHPSARALRKDLERFISGPQARLDEYMLHLFGSERAREQMAMRDEISALVRRPESPAATIPSVERIQTLVTHSKLGAAEPVASGNPSTGDSTAPPVAVAAREAPTEAPRPTPPRKKRSFVPWLIGGLIALLLGVVLVGLVVMALAAVGWFTLGAAPSPDDVGLAPDLSGPGPDGSGQTADLDPGVGDDGSAEESTASAGDMGATDPVAPEPTPELATPAPPTAGPSTAEPATPAPVTAESTASPADGQRPGEHGETTTAADEVPDAANSAPTIDHTPPSRGVRGKAIVIDLTVTPPGSYQAVLFYRATPDGAWSTTSVTGNGRDMLRLSIPREVAQEPSADGVDYYIEVVGGGTTIRSGSEGAPFHIRVR